MVNNYFVFNGNEYGIGSIVKLHQNSKQYFKFNSMLKFTGYSVEEDAYYFTSLYDTWQIYKMTHSQIDEYIEKVEYCATKEIKCIDSQKMNSEYIDGIVSAWIWYIFVMIFALLLNGIGNVIITQIATSIIFWNWRNKKMNGE